MDSFEHVIAAILERQGFWRLPSFKVELTKDEKVAIGRHSSPRWEIDIVAYRPRDNELRVVECKSYLGAWRRLRRVRRFPDLQLRRAYKLFCDSALRRVVLSRLTKQLVEKGFCPPKPRVRLCASEPGRSAQTSRVSGRTSKSRAGF